MSDLNLNVAMIGPRKCGKTSVLSIMLAEVENFIARLNTNPNVQKYCFPEIKADSFCIETLKSSYNDLKSIAIRNVIKDGVDVILGTDTPNIYNIDLSVCGVLTTISFHDFPGGYFLPESHDSITKKEERLKDCFEVFAKADVIVLCIDVPSQITYPNPQKKAMYASYTKYITKLIQENAPKESANKLRKTIMVLPIKCEGAILDTTPNSYDDSYTQAINPDKNENLYKSIKNLYNDLFTYLESDTVADSFFLPVITMGCVKATGVQYDEISGSTCISFEPVIKGRQLKYHQCNSSSLLALCLWSAEAIITQKYIANSSFWEKIKAAFKGRWPTQWFRDQLLKECSLHRVYWDYISTQTDYANLSDEAKQFCEELRREADTQPFTGCRLI